MEASTLNAPALSRLGLPSALLKLRSDEQLVSLFRAGSEDAFAVIHDRYRQRLFAYVRQMLSATSRQDAEDVLQDVFMRAYGALRADTREVNLRAWLYRVAHNRCIDHLRRPTPPEREVFEMSRRPLHDPIVEAQRREDLRRLVEDVGRLPEQQRSALLMREMDGMAYADIAEALDVTVPAVKSLLVRARVGLVEAIEARETDCETIREDLTASYDRGVKSSARARKHMRECAGCREYRSALKGMRRQFASLTPVGAFAPAALLAKVLGVGGAGGGAAAGGSAAVGGGATVVGTATACKVAAVVCTAAITAGGAAEMNRMAGDPAPKKDRPVAAARTAKAGGPVASAAAASVAAAPLGAKVLGEQAAPVAARERAAAPARPAREDAVAVTPVVAAPEAAVPALDLPSGTGGAAAPADDAAPKPPSQSTTSTGSPQTTTTQPGAGTAQDPATDEPAQQSTSAPQGSSEPPPEH